MSFLEGIFSRRKDNLVRHAKSWVPPKGQQGQRVNSIVLAYVLVLILVATFLSGIFHGGAMIFYGAAILGVTQPAQRRVIPPIFNYVAERVGWPLLIILDEVEPSCPDLTTAVHQPTPAAVLVPDVACEPSPDPTVAPGSMTRFSEESHKMLGLWKSVSPELRTPDNAAKLLEKLCIAEGPASDPILSLWTKANASSRPAIATQMLDTLVEQRAA